MKEMDKKILLIANHPGYIYSLRKEIIESLVKEEYRVAICSPDGPELKYFRGLGCEYFPNSINRHGKNIFEELKLKKEFGTVMDQFKPDITLLYTIKPNLYGGMEAARRNIPYIMNITGLGTALEKKSFLQKILIQVYKYVCKNANTVFLQNQENMDFFFKHNIATDKLELLPGSGVNLKEFEFTPLYTNKAKTSFLFIGRLMKSKGIHEFIEAAKKIKKAYSSTEFHVIGLVEEERILTEIEAIPDVICYHGLVKDVKPFIIKSDCVVLPSYHEGMANTLLEGAAIGRPLIATNISGCKEIIVDGENGYLVEKQNASDLAKKMKQIIELADEERQVMSKKSRARMEQMFSRQIIVDKYINKIKKL